MEGFQISPAVLRILFRIEKLNLFFELHPDLGVFSSKGEFLRVKESLSATNDLLVYGTDCGQFVLR